MLREVQQTPEPRDISLSLIGRQGFVDELLQISQDGFVILQSIGACHEGLRCSLITQVHALGPVGFVAVEHWFRDPQVENVVGECLEPCATLNNLFP